jgi:peptidoglycan/LPS O-acetylase OafA/YrhL
LDSHCFARRPSSLRQAGKRRGEENNERRVLCEKPWGDVNTARGTRLETCREVKNRILMGALRFLLAIAVIFAHAGLFMGFGLVGGDGAVETFFIISGFYIALILNEKYIKANDSYQLFITNRFLRLFPLYWTVLILTVFCAFLIPGFNKTANLGGLGQWRFYRHLLGSGNIVFLVFTNLVIFFQDALLYMGWNVKTGSIFFTAKFWTTTPPLYNFLLVPQAWSLSIELMFYLVAPFLLKRRFILMLVVLLVSWGLKIYFYHRGLNFDPWSYRFLPFELMFFLLGAFAYFFYNRFVHPRSWPKLFNLTIYIGLIMITVFFSFFHFPFKLTAYYAIIVITLPFLFHYTKNFKIDRLLGELSYPLYICHILVLNIIRSMGITRGQNILTVLGSVVLSVLLIKLIGNRVEKLRQSRVKKQKGVNNVSDALSVSLLHSKSGKRDE